MENKTNEKTEKKNIRILVIDDELGLRNLLEYELTKNGFMVNTASNGFEGVEAFKKNNYQLVISDIKMPKMDGLQVLDAIKKNDPDVEVILVTGFGSIEIAVNAMKKGAYDFIQKPFNIDEMLALVDKAVEKVELKTMVALYETSRIIFSELKISELLPLLIKQSGKVLKADNVSIMLANRHGELEVTAPSDTGSDRTRKIHLEIARKMAKKTAADKGLNNYTGIIKIDPLLAQIKDADKIHSYILNPLKSKTEIMGYFCATRSESDLPFTEADKRFLGIFSSQVSQALENAEIYGQLEEKVKALTEANEKLSNMQRELVQSEKLASLGQLASGVAHEINNPLTVIAGLTELLTSVSNDASIKEDLKSVKEQTERCRKVVMNLLHFADKQQVQKIETDLNTLVRWAVEIKKSEFAKEGVTIEEIYAEDLSSILASETQLKNAFISVIENAFEAILASKKDKPKLTIKTEVKDKNIITRFIDNGCGIPDGMIDKIFDPFFTTKVVGTGAGTGMGLSIAYSALIENDGTIKVKSKPGEGSEFIIELPQAHK